jgi:translocator protein
VHACWPWTCACMLAIVRSWTPSLLQSIGDTWNYINTAQARLGWAAVFSTALVWPAAAVQVYLYWQTSPTAGLTLLPLVIWLSVANVLIWSIWDRNGRQPLLPLEGAE